MTNNTEEHIETGNRRLWPWFILLGIIFFAAVLRLSLKTDFVRDIVKAQVVSSANEQLSVNLSIRELKGDLWKEVILHGISVTDTDNDTLGSIDSVRVGYNILSYFRPIFRVPVISISEPFIKLRQKNGEFNLSTWLEPSPQDTSQTEPFPVRVDNFQLSGGKVDAQIESLKEDSAFVIANLQLISSFALLESGYEASISDFSFDLLQTRLGEKVSLESSLQAQKQTISLERLVLATGNSIIRSTGKFNTQDSTASLDLQAMPLSWRDIAAYVDQMPVEQNLEVELQASGNMSQFQLDLGLEAGGINDLELSTSFSWDSTIALTSITAKAERLNLVSFLSDSTMPDIKDLAFEGTGYIPLQAFKEGSFKGSLTTENIRYKPHELDLLESTFSFENEVLDATLNTQSANQKIQADISISNVWDSQAGIEFIVEGRNINPGYWLQDDQYDGSISFNGKLTGTGLTPEESSWKYSLDFAKGKIAQQSFNRISLNGSFNNSSITNETELQINGGKISLKAGVDNYRETPQFSYEISGNSFDLSEFKMLEDFKTSLTFTASGEGTGSSLKNLSMRTAITVDSSLVNGERIKSLQANIQIEDTVVSVSEAALQSTIAEGSFDARFDLERWYDTDNELNFNLQLKDLQALAPLAETEVLQAEGNIRGKLVPDREENLKFTGNIEFTNIKYDEIFTAGEASGGLEVIVKKAPEYTFDLELISPMISTVQLQDLKLKTKGEISGQEVAGSFELNFAGTSEGAILHGGEYRIQPDSSVITTDRYEVTSSQLKLTLQQPFRVTVQNQSVSMDTMRLASGDGTLLELAVPYADSLRQSAHLVGKELNISEIQSILLGKIYIDGILSGNLAVANTDTSLEASANLLMTELSYEGASLDSLIMDLNIVDNLLNGSLSITDNNEELLTGDINLPFKFGDPAKFDESFYKKPVEGSLRVKRVALNNFGNLMKSMGIVETGGILDVNADLSGTAVEPRFSASMVLDSARISGVDIDSITARIKYVQESSTLSLSAAVNTLKQRAADIKAEIPFRISLPDGEISLPGKRDDLNVTVETSNFNLAALNDFVDRETVRNIKGRVNGKVNIKGSIDEFDANGELSFSESSFRVVETGVTVEGIRSTLAFSPDLVTVKNFRARSGSGSMNMNGSIIFEELVPGDLDLALSAKNFRVANTSEINAAINLDTKVGGSFTKPDVSGSLTVVNGFIQLDNFGERSVEAVQLDTTEQIDYSVSLYDSLSMDMDIAFNRRFFIRNQRFLELEVELDGSVDMLKETGEDMQMFGNLRAVSGYARPLGKRFELEEGSVTFTGEPANPDLNIRTLFEPLQPEEEIKIWYTIEGRVEEPQFKYESSPPMELDDILCYTLFGQPCYALDSWKQAIASTGGSGGGTELALNLFSDRIETLAAQSLGIDVFRIDNATVGGKTGTSITTGWYINPKVFFAIQNIVTGTAPDTSFLLEYSLLQNLKLILSQGNESGQALDIMWNYDY